MSRKALSKFLLAGGLMVALAAGGCDGANNVVGNNDAGDAGGIEDNFGPAFAAAFNANANDAPVDPGANDAGGVQLNADPVNF